MSDENSCSTCDDSGCAASQQRSGERESDFQERQAIAARMCRITHKVVVLSGKGGVGKSTVATNLAMSLARSGKRVGLLDVDIHGPSIPKLLDLEGSPVKGTDTSILPVVAAEGLQVMSIGPLIGKGDDAVVWRGPMKYGAIKQFLRDVEWGDLDYLVVDSPPGTGDEPMAVIQLIGDPDGAVIVTTPQQVAIQDVRRSIGFCRQLDLPVLGVIENMSGFVCPDCGSRSDIFGVGGGETMASRLDVPYLGAVPIDPRVVTSGDSGKPIVQALPDSPTAKALNGAAAQVMERLAAKG